MLKSERANYILKRLDELYPNPPIPLNSNKCQSELLINACFTRTSKEV